MESDQQHPEIDTHHLLTALTIVLGNAQTVLRHIHRGRITELAEVTPYLEMIEQEARRAAQEFRNLADLLNAEEQDEAR